MAESLTATDKPLIVVGIETMGNHGVILLKINSLIPSVSAFKM
jgi:hypothetical protein